jgi:ketosteroid isomerase-like protein
MDNELTELESSFWTGGPDAYRDHTTEDCVMVFGEPVGALGKTQVIDSISQGARWARVKIDDATTTHLAEGVILLIYRADAEQEDGTPYSTMASSIYVQDDGGWKLAFHQQSPPLG